MTFQSCALIFRFHFVFDLQVQAYYIDLVWKQDKLQKKKPQNHRLQSNTLGFTCFSSGLTKSNLQAITFLVLLLKFTISRRYYVVYLIFAQFRQKQQKETIDLVKRNFLIENTSSYLYEFHLDITVGEIGGGKRKIYVF